MASKERKISERSLENLKLGAEARRQGKERHNYTILPETHEWLGKGGNASQRLDELVKAAKSGELKSSYTHDRKDEVQSNSNHVYEQIEALKHEVAHLQKQLEGQAAKAGEWYGIAKERQQEIERLQSQQQFPDLELECDRYLASLRLGKQAPEYKRTKSTLDRFITFISQA